jgi:fatty-acyl-CoA synthase
MTRRQSVRMFTVPDLLDRQADRHGDRTAVVFPGARMTYAELGDSTDRIARGLAALGVVAGDRVAILLTNSLDMYAYVFAALKVGAIAVPVNSRFKSTELRHLLRHSGARVLVTTSSEAGAADFVELLGEAFPGPGDLAAKVDLPELDQLVLLGNSSLVQGAISAADLDAAAADFSFEDLQRRASAVKLRDPAFLVYTSGTTAAPKGAIISHEAVVRQAHAIAHDRLDMTAEDRLWTAIPLFHSGGLAFAVTCMTVGAALVHAGHFDAKATPEYLERERVSICFSAFETIWLPVLDRRDFATRDLSRIRVVVITGVPERLEQMAARVPQAIQISTVAMTESSAYLCLGQLEDSYEKRMTTGGRPMPGMQCRVIDPETGVDQPTGVAGELLFRGPNCFDGYFRDEQLTATVIDADGYFHTGDQVVADEDGRLTFLGRLRDMLKVGGENVSAAEVEGYLVLHPAVQIVQVVGAPDAYYGEVPVAYVELAPGASATEDELIDFCLNKIATYRVPRYVRFVESWPMSGTKVQKYKLREQIAAELREQGITEAPRLRLARRPSAS